MATDDGSSTTTKRPAGLSSSKLITLGLALTVALAGLALLASTATATHNPDTLTVDQEGADFTSIQAAIDAADPGDTILVEPGTYPESVTVDVESLTLCATVDSGSACDPAGDARIHVLSSNAPAVSVDADDVRIEGFLVNVAGPGVGIDASGASQVAIVDNEVKTGIPEGQFGALAAMNPQHRDYWLDPFVEEVFSEDTLETISQARDDDAGFLGAQPVPAWASSNHTVDHVALYYEGQAPPAAHQMAAEQQDPPVRVYEGQGEPEELVWNGERENASEPVVTGRTTPPSGIGPGALIEDGICSASFVWTNADQTRYFLSTAGHCVVGDGVQKTGGFDVSVCYEGCIARDLRVSGEKWATLEGVFAENNGVGEDFAIAEIPESLWDEIRPAFSHWEGPTKVLQPDAGEFAVQEGWGIATGDTYLTRPRAGVFSAQNFWDQGDGSIRWMGLTTNGDSGSAVGSGVLNQDDPSQQLLDGRKVGGVVTHLCAGIDGGIPFWNCGTNFEKAEQMVVGNVSGLSDIRPVLEGETIGIPEVNVPPLAPENVTATDVSTASDAQIEVGWDFNETSPPAKEYNVYRDGAQIATVDADQTVYVDTGLTEGVEHCYQVEAENGAGTSPLSSQACATPTLADLAAPSFLHAIDAGRGDEIQLIWGEPDNGDAASYEVERVHDGTTEASFTTAPHNRSLTDTGLVEGDTYTYEVRAEDTDGDLGKIATATVTPTRDEGVWKQSRSSGSADGSTGAVGDIDVPAVYDQANVGGPVDSSPVIANLDDDPRNEIVVAQDQSGGDGSAAVAFVAYEVTDAGIREQWRQVTPISIASDGEGFGRAVPADLDGDGDLEIAAVSFYKTDADEQDFAWLSTLWALDGATGRVIDSTTDDFNPLHDVPLRVADLGGSGEHVLVLDNDPFINTESTRLSAFTLETTIDGDLVWTKDVDTEIGGDLPTAGPALLENRTGGPPSLVVAIGNRAGDGTVTNDADALFRCDFDPSSGLSVACEKVTNIDSFAFGLSTGFVQDTEHPSVVVEAFGADDRLFVIDPFTGEKSSVALPETMRTTFGLADLTRNGTAEVVTAGHYGFPVDSQNLGDVASYTFNGSSDTFTQLGLVQRRPAANSSDDVPGGPVLADIDGDGNLDALVGDESGDIVAISLDTLSDDASSTSPILWATTIGSEIEAPLALGDVDGDATLEVVAAATDGQIAVVDALSSGLEERVGVEISDTSSALVGGNDVDVQGGGGPAFPVLARAGAATAEISANTLQASGGSADADDRITGVHLAPGSTGALVAGNDIQMPGAWCDVSALDCVPPLSIGVEALAEVTVGSNTIEADLTDLEHGRLAGTIGVRDRSTATVTVTGNDIAQFGVGIFVRDADAQLDGNRIDRALSGIQLAADGVDVTDNVVTQADQGVFVAGATTFSPQDVLLRGNDLAASNVSLKFEPGTSGASIDARLNHWGVLKEDLIRETRVDGEDDSRILITPYLDADGNQHPGPIEIRCFTDPDGDGFATLSRVTTAPFLQTAVDLTLPSECLDRDGDGATHRTLILQEDEEAYNGATIDTPVTVLSNVTGRTNPPTDGIVAGGARVEANNRQAAFAFVPGSEASTVDGVSVQSEPVGAEGITVRGVGTDAGSVTLENVRLGSRENGAAAGVLIEDSTSVDIRSSVFFSGLPVIEAIDSTDTTIEDSSITLRPSATDATTGIRIVRGTGTQIEGNTLHGNLYPGSIAVELVETSDATVAGQLIENAGTGIYLDASQRIAVEDNRILLPPTSQFASDSLGISVFQGGEHSLARNFVSGAGTAVSVKQAPGVSLAQPELVAVGTGVEASDLTASNGAAPQLTVHNASFATATTPLRLTGDTADLSVDAQCNDWGVYHASLIPARIDDQGTNNTVDFQPWTSANEDDPAASCLTPPDAAFDADPVQTTRLETVQFTDQSDPGTHPIVEWRWDFGDGTTSDEQNPSHTYDSVGRFNVTLTVEDADGMVSRAVKEIQVRNLAPSIDVTGDPDVHHTKAVNLDVTASDPEGDALSLDAHLEGQENLPEGAEFVRLDEDEAELRWNPNASQYGVHDIVFEVDDGQPHNSHDQEIVPVTVRNAPPVFDPELPASVPGAVNRTLTLEVHAKETDPDTLDTINTSGLPTNATFTTEDGDGDPTTGTLTWTPDPGDEGNYTVDFIAVGPGRTTTEPVTLTITEENLPPAISFTAPAEAVEGTIVNVTATAEDPDGPQNPVSWNVSAIAVDHLPWGDTVRFPVPAENIAIDGDNLTWTGELPDDANRLEVTVTADDGLSPVSATETVGIQIHPEAEGRPPIEQNTGVSTNRPIVGEPLTLRVDATDEDGSVTNVTVRPEGADSTPITMEKSTARLWTADFTYETTGTRELVFTVEDEDGLADRERFTVNVIENTPPNVDASPEAVEGDAESPAGLTVKLDAHAIDPEARTLTASDYTWKIPGQPDATGRHVETTLPVGTHTVTVEVEDPYGAVGTDTVSVKVDDTISTSAEMVGAEGRTDGAYIIRPVGHVLERIQGWTHVTDDQLAGIAGAQVDMTVTYHGLAANDQVSVPIHNQTLTTKANGSVFWDFDQPLLGNAGRGESLLSAPGWHEITFRVATGSRPAAAVQDVETAQTTIAYWVSPSGTEPITAGAPGLR